MPEWLQVVLFLFWNTVLVTVGFGIGRALRK